MKTARIKQKLRIIAFLCMLAMIITMFSPGIVVFATSQKEDSAKEIIVTDANDLEMTFYQNKQVAFLEKSKVSCSRSKEKCIISMTQIPICIIWFLTL